jgi:hypothetical protein
MDPLLCAGVAAAFDQASYVSCQDTEIPKVFSLQEGGRECDERSFVFLTVRNKLP